MIASGMKLCRECVVRTEETPGSELCFLCRVRSVGFSFVGGGGYTRHSFHERTTAEARAQILGDKVVGVDVVPASDYGR
jgi:hypothetical protein